MGFEANQGSRLVLIELVFMLVATACGLGLTAWMVDDPVLRITHIDIPMYDEYVVLHTTTSLAYFSIWVAAWLYTVRTLWTGFAIRRIYMLMLSVVGLHLVQLGYFLAMCIGWKLNVPHDSQLVDSFFWYNAIGFFFWLTVTGLALFRIFRKAPLDPSHALTP